MKARNKCGAAAHRAPSPPRGRPFFAARGVEPRKVARQYLVYFEYFIKYIVDHNNLYIYMVPLL